MSDSNMTLSSRTQKIRDEFDWVDFKHEENKITYGQLNKTFNGQLQHHGWNVVTYKKLNDEINTMYQKAWIPTAIGTALLVFGTFATVLWLGFGSDNLFLLIAGSAAAGLTAASLIPLAIGSYNTAKYCSHYNHRLTAQEKVKEQDRFVEELEEENSRATKIINELGRGVEAKTALIDKIGPGMPLNDLIGGDQVDSGLNDGSDIED